MGTERGSRLRRLLFSWLLLVSMVCGNALADEPGLFEVQTVGIMTSDSVLLATDVYLPGEGDRFPVVLARTPYGSKTKVWLGEGLALSGYAVVIQNVRGTHGSEGEFFPFVYEKRDGLETLEWVLAQPWSNGRVGMQPLRSRAPGIPVWYPCFTCPAGRIWSLSCSTGEHSI